MDVSTCSHQKVLELINSKQYIEALRIAGPLFDVNPDDYLLWYLSSKCLYHLSCQEAAAKNIQKACIALAKSGHPVWSIVCAIDYASWNNDAASLLDQIASLYCSESTVLEEKRVEPPILSSSMIRPWQNNLSDSEVIGKIKDLMAVCWGQSMTLDNSGETLPFLPLLSTLGKANFTRLVSCFESQTFDSGDIIVQQGEIGKALFVIAFGTVKIVNKEQSEEETYLASLGPGAFFGEMAIVSSSPRAASVIAENVTTLLVASKESLEELAAEESLVADVLVAFCHARMLENLMRTSPVLSPVPAEKRLDLIAQFDTDYYSKGDVIIQEGVMGEGLFLLVSGGVSVFKKSDDKPVQIARLKPGDLFGEISLLLQKEATATVIANQNTALLKLGYEEFHKITDEYPQLLKGAYTIALEREKQNNSILGQKAESADSLILI